MAVCHFIAIKTNGQRRMGVEHWQADKSFGIVADILKMMRKPHMWKHGLERELREIESVLKPYEVLLIICGSEYIRRRGVRQKSHEEIVVRRSGPSCVAVSPFNRPQLGQQL